MKKGLTQTLFGKRDKPVAAPTPVTDEKLKEVVQRSIVAQQQVVSASQRLQDTLNDLVDVMARDRGSSHV